MKTTISPLILSSKLWSCTVLNLSQVATFLSKMLTVSGEMILALSGVWERAGNILLSDVPAASHPLG